MKPSILRNLLLACLALGLLMGGLFPVYAQAFVQLKPGMLGGFIAGSLLVGAVAGALNYWLVNMILLTRLERISEVANAISQNDIARRCEIQSDDLIGEIVASFNRMSENLRNVIGQISGATTQLASAAEEMSAVTEEASRGVQHQQTEMSPPP
ncbi:MAG: HAMP domain-containing protein [Gammaproteobacteria bacterium]